MPADTSRLLHWTLFQGAKNAQIAKRLHTPFHKTIDAMLKTGAKALPPTKAAGTAFSPVKYMDTATKRGSSHVEFVSALVLDFDGGGTFDDLVELWGDWTCWISTTWSSGIGRQERCRVVLPFTRDVTPKEFRKIWTWASDRTVAAGLVLDKACKDVARLWFFPYSKDGKSPSNPDADFKSRIIEGPLSWLDPDNVLAGMLDEAAMGAPAGVTEELSGDLIFHSANGPVTVSDWARTAPPGAKLQGYCIDVEESSYGASFLRRRRAGVLYVCTSPNHGHAEPKMLWWADPNATGARPARDNGILNQLDWKIDDNGNRTSLIRTDHNAETILMEDKRWKGRIWYDEWAHVERFDDEALADHHVASLRSWIERVYGLRYPITDLWHIVEAVSRRNAHNPFVVRLENYRWDGVSRLDDFLIRAFRVDLSHPDFADRALLYRELPKRWLIGAVTRAFEPGSKMDGTLILAGRESVGKSSFFRILAGDDAFCDTLLNIENPTQYVYAITGAWFIEFAELDSIRRRDHTRVKGFLTQQDDTFRPAYGRKTVQRPRSCVFCGTTNHLDFIQDDDTGTRRFWALTIQTELDWDYLHTYREQILAEAVERYHQGETWRLPREVEDLLAGKTAEYHHAEDPTLDIVREILDERPNLPALRTVQLLYWFHQKLTATNIRLPGVTERQLQMRFGKVLAERGWKKTVQRVNGEVKRFFIAPDVSMVDAIRHLSMTSDMPTDLQIRH